MTTAEPQSIDTILDENKKFIRRKLAEINIHRPELDAMLAAYEKSMRDRFPEGTTFTCVGTFTGEPA
jgi:hypothetical protein